MKTLFSLALLALMLVSCKAVEPTACPDTAMVEWGYSYMQENGTLQELHGCAFPQQIDSIMVSVLLGGATAPGVDDDNT